MALDITNGTAEGAEITNDASWDSPSEFTFLTWIYPTTIAGFDFIFEASGTGLWRLITEGSAGAIQGLVFRNGGSGSNRDSVTGTLVANEWNYIGFSWDETNATQLYRGDLDAVATETAYGFEDAGPAGSLDAVTSPFRVGHNSASNNSIPGRIANCMFYHTSLSEAQIQAQQFSQIPLFDNCKFAHIYHDASATQADYSGNGNTGAVQSGTTDGAHISLPSPFSFDDAAPFMVDAAVPAVDSYNTSILRGVAQGVMRGAR